MIIRSIVPRTCVALIATLAMLAAWQQAGAATIYKASTDFDAAFAAGNGGLSGGPFSFGYAGSLGGSITPYTAAQTISSINFLHASGLSGDNLSPLVSRNTSASSVTWSTVTLAGNEMAFHPGEGAFQYSIIRFTAPQTATYAFNAEFVGRDVFGTTTTVYALVNGVQTFSSAVSGFNGPPVTYAPSIGLAQGDTIDIAVGRGANRSYYNDTTGLGANLSASVVPTPAAIWGGLLLGCLVVSRRRR
ncbi:MAG: hypothetical protein NTU53_19875 [Planctomycetota bacterium]|nr:hypothetical protein [Planctomycetota bacterium]